MKRLTDRRTVLLATGSAVAAAAFAEVVAAQPPAIRGTVAFDDGSAIPEGGIVIYFEDPALQDNARLRAVNTRIDSDGQSTTIGFSLSPPAGAAASPTLLIVAQLERADGWLLARGSAQFTPDAPIHIALNTVMY
ncbi:hypothetical protein [Paracoccus sp. (in: a-proteobacteria)]|uniref:hypothetical protein n=1 Tax=Paracoccus sp. TaxID=267 RepID=UPI0035AEDB45